MIGRFGCTVRLRGGWGDNAQSHARCVCPVCGVREVLGTARGQLMHGCSARHELDAVAAKLDAHLDSEVQSSLKVYSVTDTICLQPASSRRQAVYVDAARCFSKFI
eukprot:4166466-Pleurochrysis_carterae.AAC.1